METLIAYPKNETEAKKIKDFFESLEIKYEAEIEIDKTQRFFQKPLHARKLNNDINDLKNGKGDVVSLNEMKSKFMQDFENGETIEQSQDFVLKHIDELWKK